MKNHKSQATVQESWKISEKDIEAAWNKKTEQFAEYKNYFSDLYKNKKSDS